MYSISFSASLSSGVVNDIGATAFAFMRVPKTDAFAITVPLEDIDTSPFRRSFVPPVWDLFGKGETFHIRTLVPEDTKEEPPGFNDSSWRQYVTDMDEDTLREKIQIYYDNNLINLM